MLRLLDCFAGVGGFSLGFERTLGFKTVAFCEIEPFCQRVLRKHWPDVPIFPDIRTLGVAAFKERGLEYPHVITGGFPCQDISTAGKGAGLDGERSGLWFELLRIVSEFAAAAREEGKAEPWLVAENVPALRTRGLEVCLRGLASIGYDAEWHCIPACVVGAPHRRDRIWIVAYPAGVTESEPRHQTETLSNQRNTWLEPRRRCAGQFSGEAGADVAYPERQSSELQRTSRAVDGTARPCKSAEDKREWLIPSAGCSCEDAANTDSTRLEIRESLRGDSCQEFSTIERADWGIPERGLGGIADGLSGWLDFGLKTFEHPWGPDWEDGAPRTVQEKQQDRAARLKALGNAVVPQIPELIARAILEVWS